MMNFLALDLSLTGAGYARSDGKSGVLSGKDRGPARLYRLRNQVRELAIPTTVRKGEYGPIADLVAIEGYAFSRNQRAHTQAELGGVIRLALFEACIPYVEVPPTSLKKYATGAGNAKKDAVFAAAIRRLGYQGDSNDEADALWLLEMMKERYGMGAVCVPAAHRVALGKIDWPDIVDPLN